jgi:hypothetical protein
MGLQIRTYVAGQEKYIDLYGNEDIAIEVSFAEIQDITKKNSAFTKEFRVPGSNNNNDIFNYFFDINSIALDWNPKRKFEAQLIFNGYELYAGNIRMNQVTILKTEKVYTITFYAEVGDLSANIGDKALCNVDTSSLDHSLYDSFTARTLKLDPSLHPTSLIPSGTSYWSNTINPISQGDVQYILGQRGYDYTGSTFGTILDINTPQTPILDFSGVTGYFDNVRTPVIPPYLIPSIRTRKLYELIVNQADYQIESDFFDSDYFGRYYVPLSFNTDSNYMAQSKPYDLLIENMTGSTGPNGGQIKNVAPYASPSNPLFVFKSKDLIFDTLDFNPINLANYPNDGTAFSTTGPYGLSAMTDYVFAIPQSYTNDQFIKVEFTWSWSGTPDPFGTGIIGGSISVWNMYQSSLNGSFVSGTIEDLEYINIDNTFSPQTGSGAFTVRLCPYNMFNQTGFYFVAFDNFVGDLDITSVKISMAVKSQSLPFNIELNKEMGCTNKQIEFIQDVNRMFNLVVIPHPIKPKTLIIEPIVDWIGKGETLDWTSKVDYNSPQTLRPTTSIINGSIFASNKIDKDFVNTQFNTKSNKIYGQNIFDLGIDYKNEFTNLTQQLGQNTDYYLNASGMTNIALPCYFVLKEGNKAGQATFEYRPFRSLPRMVFKSVPIPSGNTKQQGYFLREYDQDYSFCITYPSGNNYNPTDCYQMGTMPNINRLTTYPFAISGFSHYITYDASLTFTPDELIYPDADNQYDRYYRDYIEDLTSEENKIYGCKMYLQPWEVAQLYSNEVIFIKNAKFRINKITNLSLIEPGLCDVELVKLTRDYTPTPVLFYDLIECGNECNIIHSNTDLNYLLWAFGTPNPNTTGTTEGKYVELITQFGPGLNKTVKRFKVIQTEYNPNYTYQNVYFNSRTSNILSGGYLQKQVYYDYVMYDSCTTTTPSYIFDIIDTSTGSTQSCECVTMDVTNTAATRASFTFTTCSGTTSSWTLDPSSGVTVCGCYGSFTTTGFTYCPDLSGLPCTATPLPTPTPTPALSPTSTPVPSPTPTITPSPTQHCINCFELNITNNNAFECRITYYNCSTGLWTNLDIPGNTGVVIPCGCPDIITPCSNIDVIVGLACN